MRAKFIHFADCHLGYRQYGSKVRFTDFTRAFVGIINQAISEEVDFVLLAGDLFQKRSIDALTLRNAIAGLERLQRAKIPCIAVEGNHELSYYREAMGWLRFLAERDLLILLDVKFDAGQAHLQPYEQRQGAYVEPVPGLRVYGMRYQGSAVRTALESVATALAARAEQEVEYTVFVAHTGVEGVLPEHSGGLSHATLAVLRPYIDYLALGHIHKPYTFDDWIFNPGSPETCSMEEVGWVDRGYYLVDVDTASAGAHGSPAHCATLRANRRRPFYRLSFQVDHVTSPEQMVEECTASIRRQAANRIGVPSDAASDLAPVVELRLSGVLPFDRSALNLERLQMTLDDAFAPLLYQIKNQTRPAEFAVGDTDSDLTRRELEREILNDLLMRDNRFQQDTAQWTDLLLDIKQMALAGSDPDNILQALSRQLEQSGLTSTDDDLLPPGPGHEKS